MQLGLSETSRVVVVEIGEQPRVELLNLFMTLLIKGVNGTFTPGDEALRGSWPADAIFHVPQTKIVEMQSVRPDEPLSWQGERCGWPLCPYCCERPVQGH